MAGKITKPDDYAGPGPFRNHNALVRWCQHRKNWPKCPVCHKADGTKGWLCADCDKRFEEEFRGHEMSNDYVTYTRWVNKQYVAMRSRQTLDRWLHAV